LKGRDASRQKEAELSDEKEKSKKGYAYGLFFGRLLAILANKATLCLKTWVGP
jgi:hypothetical protein